MSRRKTPAKIPPESAAAENAAPENAALKGAEKGGAKKGAPTKGASAKSAASKESALKKAAPESAAAPNAPTKGETPDKKPQKRAKSTAKGAKRPAQTEKGASSKTPQVMKLVEKQSSVNPVIIAGKSAIPRQLRGVEPLSRIMRREADAVFGGEVVDLTKRLCDENAALILRRFNACCCERCVERLSQITQERLTARFVRTGSREYEEIQEPLRKAVLTQMIRELLGSRRRSFHDE